MLSILFTNSVFASQQEHDIGEITSAFKSGDKQQIAQLISYPLRRPVPLTAINSEQELIIHFYEVFDQKLIKQIAYSEAGKDWEQVG